MIATLKINLQEALTTEDFRLLVNLAIEQNKGVDAVVLDAVRASLAANVPPKTEDDDRKAALVA
jgi:hypothetical protein